jgi:hypothetical protein
VRRARLNSSSVERSALGRRVRIASARLQP